jgi:hypothetical protein
MDAIKTARVVCQRIFASKGEPFFVASLTGPRPKLIRVLPDLYHRLPQPVVVALR